MSRIGLTSCFKIYDEVQEKRKRTVVKLSLKILPVQIITNATLLNKCNTISDMTLQILIRSGKIKSCHKWMQLPRNKEKMTVAKIIWPFVYWSCWLLQTKFSCVLSTLGIFQWTMRIGLPPENKLSNFNIINTILNSYRFQLVWRYLENFY